MADTKRKADAAAKQNDTGEIGEALDLLKTYVKQETIGPLKGIGKKIGLGLAGAFLLGLGLLFLSLGLLRLIQDKLPRLASGSLSWLSYLVVIVFCALVSAVALLRIKKIEKELN